MYATLWQVMRCIMFDEHLTSEFWDFAKANKLLTNAQIREKQNETFNPAFVKFEPEEDKPYIEAFFEFLKTNPTADSKRIARELQFLREKAKKYNI